MGYLLLSDCNSRIIQGCRMQIRKDAQKTLSWFTWCLQTSTYRKWIAVVLHLLHDQESLVEVANYLNEAQVFVSLFVHLSASWRCKQEKWCDMRNNEERQFPVMSDLETEVVEIVSSLYPYNEMKDRQTRSSVVFFFWKQNTINSQEKVWRWQMIFCFLLNKWKCIPLVCHLLVFGKPASLSMPGISFTCLLWTQNTQHEEDSHPSSLIEFFKTRRNENCIAITLSVSSSHLFKR